MIESNGKTSTLRATGAGSGRTEMIDELLRRVLRVGDPRDPAEIAAALRRRYQGEAARLDQEAMGMPLVGTLGQLTSANAGPAEDSAGDRAERRARDDLGRDLAALIDAPANRPWRAELSGWRAALLREADEGGGAAAMAQDPARRDRAFLSIRVFADYARLARMAGVLHAEMRPSYRRLARSLDRCSAALRVRMGESLFDAGLGDGGVILDVPLLDLRQRGDTLIQALRGLASLEGGGADDWGEGLSSYRLLLEAIDQRSAPELKVYLREETLRATVSRLLDEVQGAVNRRDADLLQQLGATLPIEAGLLLRLRDVAEELLGGSAPKPEDAPSGPLSRFVQALTLFAAPLSRARSGSRLVELAVPLAAGGADAEAADRGARDVLRSLLVLRDARAREADCCLASGDLASTEPLKTQLKLDCILYYIDRAIDLYAQGTGVEGAWGDEERRAALAGLLTPQEKQNLKDSSLYKALYPPLEKMDESKRSDLLKALGLEFLEMEQRWRDFVLTLAPRCEQAGADLLRATDDLVKNEYFPTSLSNFLPTKSAGTPVRSPRLASMHFSESLEEVLKRFMPSTVGPNPQSSAAHAAPTPVPSTNITHEERDNLLVLLFIVAVSLLDTSGNIRPVARLSDRSGLRSYAANILPDNGDVMTWTELRRRLLAKRSFVEQYGSLLKDLDDLFEKSTTSEQLNKCLKAVFSITIPS